MNILYLYAHPAVDSFNKSLKDTAIRQLQEANHQVVVSDLYAEKFNPVASSDDFTLSALELNPQYFLSQKIASEQHAFSADIQTEMNKLANADHVILQFPLWWFSVPAILKGWMDRVFAKGFAYDTNQIFENGLLKGKTASIIVTTQSAESAYQPDGAHGTTLEHFLLPIHHTLKFAGLKIKMPFVVYGAFDINDDRRADIFNQIEKYFSKEI